MRWIATDFFARSPVMTLPVIAMLLFMAVFVASAIRAFRTARDTHDELAKLPLEEDRSHE